MEGRGLRSVQPGVKLHPTRQRNLVYINVSFDPDLFLQYPHINCTDYPKNKYHCVMQQ